VIDVGIIIDRLVSLSANYTIIQSNNWCKV